MDEWLHDTYFGKTCIVNVERQSKVYGEGRIVNCYGVRRWEEYG